MSDTKYCKHCGEIIDSDCIICPKCGKQVEELKGAQPQGVIINTNVQANANATTIGGKKCDKTTALILCIFGGMFGLHKFYEGKILIGIIYICTAGLFLIGWIMDIITILGKPNPYYV